MSIKIALLTGFTIAIILVFSTLFIGHLRVFIILIVTSLIGIAVSTIRGSKKTGSESTHDEDL